MLTRQNREDLETRGFTVVPGVVSEEDCDRHQEYFRQWLAKFPDGTWPQTIFSLIQRYRTGYMPPAWEVRLEAKKIFAELWGTDKLLTSIDGIAIGRPPEESEEEFWQEGDNWLHVDQRADRVGIHAYQGSVYLEACDEDDWTFEVIEGSHKYFEEFMKTSRQWQCRNVTKSDLEWFEQRGCKRVRIPCPKGGLVLWESRLFHANVRPIRGRSHSGRWRYIVFVCMNPASWASACDLKFKRMAFNLMNMTSHWPSQEMAMFPYTVDEGFPERVGMDELPEIAKTDEVKRLVGVLPYEDKEGDHEPEYRPKWDKETWRDFINSTEFVSLKIDDTKDE